LELKVFLAGRVAVEANGVLVDEERFPGRQGRLVFAYLVAEEGRPVPHDELAEAVWGDAPPATWEKALSVVVSKLRALLAQHGVGNVLTGAFGCYRLNLPAGTWVDVVAAADAAREAEAALAGDDLEQAKALAGQVASTARRPFLPGEAGEWVEAKRRELADVLRRALACLSDACLRSGDEAEAAKWAEEMVAVEPFREVGYRRLMEAHAAAGNRAEALRVYERCRRLLAEELGAYPSPETEASYRQLLEAPPTEARARALKTAVVSTPESEPASAARAPLSRRSRRRGALAIGGSLLLAAAIAVPVIEFTGGGSPGLGSAAENAVALIKADTNRLVADVPVGNGPTSIAVADDAVWVTNAQDGSVARIDPETTSVVAHIPVGSQPSGIGVGGGAVWVASSLDGTVMRIDSETNAVVQTERDIVTPTAVAAGFGSVWVTSADERSVKRIDGTSGHVIETIPTGAVGRGIAIGAGSVWVSDESSGRVVRIDPTSGNVVRTVNVGNGPTGIAFGAGSVWVANSLDGTVSRIDPKTNTVTAMVSVGEGPGGIAAASDAVWASVELSQSIVRIDPAKDRVVERIPVGNRPKGLAVAEDRVWFAVQPSGAGHRGGRLVVAKFPIGSIDPADAGRSLGNVYDGLLGAAQRGGSEGTQIVPNLAASLPVVTAGGTRYAFQLRRGVHYSDGTPVRASDFRRAFERLFRVRAFPAAWFLSLVGGDVCERRPRRCDLSRGVVTDDATGTIVLHLRQPDGEFLFNLLGNPAPIPPGTPDRLVRTRPVPSTGPYMIASYVPGRTLKLVRNPYFRVWSKTARPDGFPDEIEFKLRLSTGTAVTERAVTAVERGQVDVAMGVPAERLQEVKTRYASQLHLDPLVATHFIFLNTTLPPFDDVRVRRALNYAVDRAAVAKAQGGPEVARSTCQLRPPSVAGYRPYCPYTIDPSPTGEWKAPDLVRARRLVAASGTAGMKVTVWTMPARAPATREVVSALKRLGYQARLKQIEAIDYFPKVLDRKTRVQAAMSGLVGGPGSPPSSFLPLLTCNSIRPTGPQWENPSFFCNRRIDARIGRALRIQATDRDAAVHLWVGIERELVDQAPWVPLYTPRPADFVSKRVRNYQYNPELGILLDQLWVR
jgi:YVTN family beta-propeller protein